MSDTWGLWGCIIVYTATIFWFGLFLQTKSDQRQLRVFEETAFSDGCKKCAQFEKLQCERDNTLQGQEGFTQIP